MRTKTVPLTIKEGIMRLKNKNKTIRDMGQTFGLPKSVVWKIIKKKEWTGELCNHKGTGRLRKTENKNPQRPVQQIRTSLQEVDVSLSETTIPRRLHEQKYRGYTATC